MTIEQPDIEKDIEGFLSSKWPRPATGYVVKSLYIPPDGVDMETKVRRAERFSALADAVAAFRAESTTQMSWAVLQTVKPRPVETLASKHADGGMSRSDGFEQRGETWYWQSVTGEKRQDGVPIHQAVRVAAPAPLSEQLDELSRRAAELLKPDSCVQLSPRLRAGTQRIADWKKPPPGTEP